MHLFLSVDAINFAVAQNPPSGVESTTESKSAVIRKRVPRTKKIPFALVEYFSSENYFKAANLSEQVQRLQNHAEEIDRLIIPLVYHIDYTTYPGWKDPYAEASNTELQKEYALALKAPKIVPGQAITNGHRLSQPRQMKLLSKDIEKMLRVQPRVLLKIQKTVVEKQHLVKVNYEVVGVSKSKKRQYELFCAISQDGIERKVTSGPNGGQTLVHYGLVRVKKSRRFSRASMKGKIEVSYPADLAVDASRLTCVVKDLDSRRSLAAISESLL